MGSESSPAIDRFGPELKTEDPSASKLDDSTTSTSDDGSTNAPIMSSRFDFLPANTNFTVSICAVTRSQECGQMEMGSCKMRAMPPKTDLLSRGFQWVKWKWDRVRCEQCP